MREEAEGGEILRQASFAQTASLCERASRATASEECGVKAYGKRHLLIDKYAARVEANMNHQNDLNNRNQREFFRTVLPIWLSESANCQLRDSKLVHRHQF